MGEPKLWQKIIWDQFGASIDMFENAITTCPNECWDNDTKFWYIAYHTMFYTDYYLTANPEGFEPPLPFTLSEFDPSGKLPERVYAKEELITYLGFIRTKFHAAMQVFPEVYISQRFINPYKNYSLTEMHLYNMRHVQHHTAQLNLLLRQQHIEVPRWVSQTNAVL